MWLSKVMRLYALEILFYYYHILDHALWSVTWPTKAPARNASPNSGSSFSEPTDQ